MMIMEKQKVYIGLADKKSLDIEESIYLKDLGEVYCSSENLRKKIENTKVYTGKKEETWDYITAIEIAETLTSKFADIDIQFIGGDKIILEIKSRENRSSLLQIGKLTFVCITLFFGAALGIMYFHEDVNMTKALERLYFTYTGEHKENPLIMNIPYSIGLGVGMFTFFMRIMSSSKRRRMEPGPMDVELYLYDNDLEDYLMNELLEKKPRNRR
ncbi:hypothetical protein E9840_04725 [Tissierella creatinini]|nr:hypothetical protein E9840_04725 [Tissierella creatinini]TJX67147.1 hypothetical protein E8P77_05955 [Soehngenia saccharolytica]